ncbi:MAG: LemA family protein [Alphaproteobacteria bacterium]|nr:LemA family protein [Alphaproteobacteria bacterium]
MELLLIIFLIGGVGFWATKLYNRLRILSEAVKRSQSNLVGELKKRATLANQLIDVCKGYGDHEKLTHLTVASQNQDSGDAQQMATATSRALAGISYVAERFPELKANQTYNTLMGQLQTIENDLQAKREALNAEVERYNGYRASMPAVLVAQQLGFPEASYFSSDEEGLEAGANFRTDDGELLRAQFARIGKGVGEATKQIGNAAGSAMKQAQASLAKPADPEPQPESEIEKDRPTQ